jgi:two-component system, NarL family, response regulator NreC
MTGTWKNADRPLRVALVDDHQVVREGLSMVLDAVEQIEVVGAAGTLAEAFRIVSSRRPDVLVLDLRMPGESPLDALPHFARLAPEMAVVILTMQEQPRCARAALQAGARGYVLKEAAGRELVQAVRLAHEGHTYLAPELGARIAAEPRSGPDGLARRELEVLRLLALGHTNAEIGERLFLSPRTVESYRARVQQKTGRFSRAELVRYALEHELLDIAV